MRTLLNQDMGEVSAGNGGKTLGSWEELSAHFMLPLTINFPIRAHKILNMGDISTFNAAVSFSTDCFTANFTHFLASEQLRFYTSSTLISPYCQYSYIHTDPPEKALNSCIMEAGGRGRTKLIAIPAAYQANITCAHCQQHMY